MIMENPNERIQELENKLEIIIKELSSYHNQIALLQTEVRNLRQKEVPLTPAKAEIRPAVPATKPLVIAKPQVNFKTEEFLGGNLLSKIGIMILVIGVGIFVKYAIDNNLVSPEARIVLGYLAGFGLGSLAYYLKAKYHTYSSVLMSGAMAILYFTTFSAYNSYHFFPLWLTFGLMVIITVLTVYFAVLYDRQWIGIWSLVGAYAIPFLLSDDSGEAWKLFTYITIVNLGILWLLARKNWYWLAGTAYGFTWLIFMIGHRSNYTESHNIFVNALFSGIFFLLSVGYLLIRFFRNKSLTTLEIIYLGLSIFIFYFFNINMYSSVDQGQYKSIFSLVFTLFSVAFTYYLFKKEAINTSFFRVMVVATIAVLYLTGYLQIAHWYDSRSPAYSNINYPIHDAFNTIWQYNYLMAFVSGLTYLCLRFKIKTDMILLTLIFLSAMALLFSFLDNETSTLRLRFMEAKLSSIGLWIRYVQYIFIGILIYLNLKIIDLLPDFFKVLKDSKYLILSFIILCVLSSETTTVWMLFDRTKAVSQAEASTRVGYSVLWAIFALAMLVIGFYKRNKAFRISGIVLLGIVILKLFFNDLVNISTISKIVLFISVGVLLLIASFLYQRLSKRLLEE
jgi:uncharacterized membrane protein